MYINQSNQVMYNNRPSFQKLIVDSEGMSPKLHYDIATNDEVRRAATYFDRQGADVVASKKQVYGRDGALKAVLNISVSDKHSNTDVYRREISINNTYPLDDFRADYFIKHYKMKKEYEEIGPDGMSKKAVEAINDFNNYLAGSYPVGI